MRYWTGAGAAFGLGGLIGFMIGWAALEKRTKQEYEERLETYKSAHQLAENLQSSGYFGDGVTYKPGDTATTLPDGTEVDLSEETWVETPIITQDEPVRNDYHKAISALETPHEVFVDGGVNDYGISYIEEEEYMDEDGRSKNQIILLLDEHNPVFLMDGQPIDDWAERIGDSILVDFYKLVPPELEPVLYVRNHRTDEDYEVVRQMP